MIKDTPNIILYKNKYWASVQYVAENTGVDALYIMDYTTRSNINRYASTLYNGEKYISIDSVPKKELLGNDLFLSRVAVEVLDENIKRFRNDFYNQCYYSNHLDNAAYYFTEAGIKITYDKAKEIDQFGNILIEIIEFPYWDYNLSKIEFLEQACIVASELCSIFKLKRTSLQNKLTKMPKDRSELRDWIIPKYYGNNNSRKFGRSDQKLVNKNTGEVSKFDIHERITFYYWINPGKSNKLNKRQVYDRYLQECERLEITPCGFSTIKSYINKKRMFLSLERDGKDTFRSKYAPYVPAEKLQFSGSQWSADYSGSKLGYYTSDGKVKSLNVIRIIDTFSGKVVGWNAVAEGESPKATLRAFENALTTEKYTAFELVTDNGGAFTGKEIAPRLKRLFHKHRTIQLGNKQANPAENFVRRVSEYSRELDNWTMLGFNSSFKNEHSRANEDYAGVGILASKEEAIEQIAQLFDRWNNERDYKMKKTRIEAHEEHRDPKLKQLSQENKFFAFSNHSTINVAECRGIIKLQLGYDEFKYQFENFGYALDEIEQHCSTSELKVIAAFTKTEAHIYSLTGEYIMPLISAKLAHKSFSEATPNSQENLNTHLAHKANFEKQAKEFTTQTTDPEFIEDLPYLSAVKLKQGGKNEQEKRTDERFEKITSKAVKNAKTKSDKTLKNDNEDFDTQAFLLSVM